MPVVIQDFELQPEPAPAARGTPTAASPAAAPTIEPPPDVERKEQERRERALRLYAH